MRSIAELRPEIEGLRAGFEEQLAALVEIPSVSMEPERGSDMGRCADLAVEYLRSAGAQARRLETAGPPLVIGKFPGDPSWPTITVYNHLDVQPADPVEWDSPPFKFTRDDEPGGGPRWFGRGTTDDKGPALTALLGARLAARDGVKANLQFLWELEEEIGSPHFEQGLQAARAEGFSTDLVAVSDTIWLSAGRPALPYGLRGLMGFTVSLTTGAKDVHSGTTGGAARNPIGELAQLIAECYDARTGRVKIPGFHDDVRKLSAGERAGLRRAGFSRKRFQAAHELASVRFRDDQQLAEAIMTRPTFEVHGIAGGYSGPGIKTIVPHAAEAKLSTRLVPDQDPEKVFKRIQRFIKARCPDAVVTHQTSLAPYLGDIGGPYHEAAVAAMKAAFGQQPGLTREGGSIGAVLTMRRLLGAPVVFLGLSLPEHGYHAVNENYDWGQAAGGTAMFYEYFHRVADLGRLPQRGSRDGVARRTTRAKMKG
jgi:acetylornithine deacetylase/succinyl-diaminopimelate desuccinylase-like protein